MNLVFVDVKIAFVQKSHKNEILSIEKRLLQELILVVGYWQKEIGSKKSTEIRRSSAVVNAQDHTM